jgi:hypothetical protein
MPMQGDLRRTGDEGVVVYLNIFQYFLGRLNKRNRILNQDKYCPHKKTSGHKQRFQALLVHFRRRCINNNWYIACVLCRLVATSDGVPL